MTDIQKIQKENMIREIQGLINEKMEMMRNAFSNAQEDVLNDQIQDLFERKRKLESE